MGKKKFKTERFEEAADLQALFLRLDEPGEESKTIEHILDLLSRLGALQQKRLTDGTRAEAIRTLRELSRLLGDYQWAAEIAYTRQGFRSILRPVNREKLSPAKKREYEDLRMLLDLTQSPDLLSRIRRCEVCQRWLFAGNKSDQKYCGDACKVRKYDSDPKRKEAKSAYMKKRYEEEKTETVRELESLRKTLGRSRSNRG